VILGIDVFSGYGVIDWAKVADAGVKFVYVKRGQGNDGLDPAWQRNVDGARAAGLYVGTYWFCYHLPTQRPGDGRSPREEMEKFFKSTSGHGTRPGELPPAIDVEWPPHFEKDKKTGAIVNLWEKWGINGQTICEWAIEAIAHVERLWGRPPVLYTYPDFWKNLGPYGKNPAFAKCPLWMATYNNLDKWMPAEGAKPHIPAPWKDYAFWQFSADGSPVRVPGVPACPLDRDVFGGSLDELRKLANIDPDAETQPELPPDPHPSDHPSELATPRIVDFEVVRKSPYDDLGSDDEPPEAA
jgi:lysozyme